MTTTPTQPTAGLTERLEEAKTIYGRLSSELYKSDKDDDARNSLAIAHNTVLEAAARISELEARVKVLEGEANVEKLATPELVNRIDTAIFLAEDKWRLVSALQQRPLGIYVAEWVLTELGYALEAAQAALAVVEGR